MHVNYTIVISHLRCLGCNDCHCHCSMPRFVARHGIFLFWVFVAISCPLPFWDTPKSMISWWYLPTKRLVSSAFCWSVWPIRSNLHWRFSAFLGSWCRTFNLWNSERESSRSRHKCRIKTIAVWSMIDSWDVAILNCGVFDFTCCILLSSSSKIVQTCPRYFQRVFRCHKLSKGWVATHYRGAGSCCLRSVKPLWQMRCHFLIYSEATQSCGMSIYHHRACFSVIAYVYVHTHVDLIFNTSIYLSIYLSLSISLSLSIELSVYLSIYLSVYLSIYI